MGSPNQVDIVGLGLHDVTAVHGDGPAALESVTLRVEPGELLAVVGPSGSGKTTLLRAIAGLAEVRQGQIVIGGHDVTRLPVERRDVAMVFESGALLPFLDVAGNLGFGLHVRHVPEAEVQSRVTAEARHLRLTRLLPRKPASLSAGERGRVGIGRALMRVASVWLLDEPLAHLDPAERSELRRRLVREVKRLGVTTVYVTHDPTEALAIGDRVAVLDQGHLIQLDSARDLYGRPASVFVADFVGSQQVGLLPARVVRSAGLAGYQVGAWTLPFWAPVPPALEGHVGRDVVLALRPEDVHDAATTDDTGFAHVVSTVVRTEFAGRDIAVTVEVEAPPVSCPGVDPSDAAAGRARLRARFPRGSNLRTGSSVTVAVDATRAHVFDASTGRALWHPAPETV